MSLQTLATPPIVNCPPLSEPSDNPIWKKSKRMRRKNKKQAGTELFQAQEKLGLAKPELPS
jgi:hypothetical protein